MKSEDGLILRNLDTGVTASLTTDQSDELVKSLDRFSKSPNKSERSPQVTQKAPPPPKRRPRLVSSSIGAPHLTPATAGMIEAKLASLPELCYRCLKISKMGQQQDRVIVLNGSAFINESTSGGKREKTRTVDLNEIVYMNAEDKLLSVTIRVVDITGWADLWCMLPSAIQQVKATAISGAKAKEPTTGFR
jgi:hypothetical protein